MAKKAGSYQKCVGSELRGRKFKSQSAAHAAMKAAAKKCKGR